MNEPERNRVAKIIADMKEKSIAASEKAEKDDAELEPHSSSEAPVQGVIENV